MGTRPVCIPTSDCISAVLEGHPHPPSLLSEPDITADGRPCPLRRGPAAFRLWHLLGRALILLSIGQILIPAAMAQAGSDSAQTDVRLKSLLSGDPEQKRTALAEIRGLHTEQTARLAVPALSDRDEIVRATAAAAVAALPKDEAAAELAPLLADKRPFVRREAAYALGVAGAVAAVTRLIDSLNKDRDLEVRSAAAIALGNIGDRSAVASLMQILRKRPDDDEEFLRRSAARSVGQIFDSLHNGTTKTLTPQNFLPPKYKDLGNANGKIAETQDVRAIVAALSSVLQNARESDDTHREAAYALGALRDPDSAGLLRTLLNAPDPYLAEISKEALLKIENAGP